MLVPLSPSAEARAFLADPANRNCWEFNASELPTMRADVLAEAEARAPALAAKHGVTLDWEDVAGIRTLLITPESWDGKAQLLYLYGGSFIMGSPLEDLFISSTLAARTGLQVVSPAYALAPEYPFPAGLNNALSVALALRPCAIAGESAGGNLALSVTRELLAKGIDLRGVALLSPAADMSRQFDPSDAPDDPTLHIPLVEEMPGIYAPGTDPFDPRLSPLYGSFGPEWPPCLITTGTRDRFVGICAQLARAMRASGGYADLRLWDGMWHVFEYYEAIPEAAASLAEIADFLNAHVGTC